MVEKRVGVGLVEGITGGTASINGRGRGEVDSVQGSRKCRSGSGCLRR